MKQLALYASTDIVRTDIVCNEQLLHGWHRTIFTIEFADGHQLSVTCDDKEGGYHKCSMEMIKP